MQNIKYTIAKPRLRSDVVAERSYPTPKVRGGGQKELPCVRDQGRLGEATSCRGQGRQLGGASWGELAAQAQEGLEELFQVEGQEGRQ